MSAALSRRRLIHGSLAVTSATALGGLLSACGDDDSSDSPAAAGGGDASEPSAPGGPWSWTDELGQTIELDEVPTRIAAYGDQAAALVGFGIRPVAIFHYMDPTDDPTFDGIDLSGIEVVGTEYGEINLEKLVSLRPELILTTYYGEDTPDTAYGFKDKAQIAKLRKIAPIGGVMQTGSALDVIATNEKLVASLGVDVEGGQVALARTAFETASAALTAAAGSGLTVLPVYGEDANLYYCKAADDPGLKYVADLGLQFVPVTGKDYYWEIVSWENADKYQPDIVLYAVRDSYSIAQLEAQPVFAKLPAVQAEQFVPWRSVSMDYPAQTAYLNELVDGLAGKQKVT